VPREFAVDFAGRVGMLYCECNTDTGEMIIPLLGAIAAAIQFKKALGKTSADCLDV
jgi:hypothetical protein